MKLIQVYDPALCCSSGVCGTSFDPALARLAGCLSQLQARGIGVERYNLAQQPLAFAENPAVKAMLETNGPETLPLVFIDGKLLSEGEYPDKHTLDTWLADTAPSSEA